MSSVLPVLGAAALLGGPGVLMLRALGSRLRVQWGWAPVVTVLLTVLLGELYRALGIPWQLLSAVLGYLLLALTAALGRTLLDARRRARGPAPRPEDAAPSADSASWSGRLSAAVTATAVACGALMVLSAGRRMGGIGTLNGSFDSFFHLSAIAFVRERGDASLTTALLDVYGEPTYYPVVFDVLASLLPVDTVTAGNAMMLATLAVLPPALAAMTAALTGPARSAPLLAVLGAAASTLFLSTAAMGLVMGLWPIMLGAVCLPVAIAAVLLLIDHEGGRSTRAKLGYGLIVLGTGLAHPSVLFSVAVVAGLHVLVRGLDRRRRGQRRRGTWQVVLALTAAALFVLVSGTMLSGMHLTRPSAEGTLSVLRQVLVDSPRIPAIPAPIWPMSALWVLAAIGATAAARHREVLGGTAVLGVLAAVVLGLSTQFENPLAIALVNPWYGARERIAPLMMCMLVLLMTRGVLALAESGRRRGTLLPAGIATGAIAATVVAGLLVPQRLPLMGSLAYTAYGVQLSPYAPPEERAFIEETAAALPEDAVLLADPLDGASLYWSLGGVETVFPTMSRPLTPDTALLARYAPRVDEPSAPSYDRICAAAERVGATHLYRDDSEHAGTRMNPPASERWSGVHDIPEHRRARVAHDGPYSLYEVDLAC